MTRGLRFALLITLCQASALFSASFLIPSDGVLVDSSDAIIVGRVSSVTPFLDPSGEVMTRIVVEPTERIKAPLSSPIGDEVSVVEPGGFVGNRAVMVSGSPFWFLGEDALLFLQTLPDGTWRTWGMLLGKFSWGRTTFGIPVAIRGAMEEEVLGLLPAGVRYQENLRHRERFLAWVRARVAGSTADPDYFLPPRRRLVSIPDPTGSAFIVEPGSLTIRADSHVPASAYSNGSFRWTLFDAGGTAVYRMTGSQPGYDYAGASQRALAAWTNEPSSNISLQLGSGSGGGFVRDRMNSIVFNASSGVPSGAIGYGQAYAEGQHNYKGEVFWTIVEGDAIFPTNLTISQTAFDEAVTHEIGHTLGLRHSDSGSPSSNYAVMRATITGTLGANLAQWDREAVAHLYGSGTVVEITRRPESDFNGDGQSDLVWRNAGTGALSIWIMNRGLLAGGGAPSPGNLGTDWDSVAVGDFNGDGRADLFWRNTRTGVNAIWFMNGTNYVGGSRPGDVADLSWSVVAADDFDGDGTDDVLWRNGATGALSIWLLRAGVLVGGGSPSPGNPGSAWSVAGVGDFNADGRADIFLRNRSTGVNAIWFMNGISYVGGGRPGDIGDPAWTSVGTGDFDANGTDDIVWRNGSTGALSIWLLNGAAPATGGGPTGGNPGVSWTVGAVGDFDGSGTADLLLRNTSTGANAIWLMSGIMVVDGTRPGDVPLQWETRAPR